MNKNSLYVFLTKCSGLFRADVTEVAKAAWLEALEEFGDDECEVAFHRTAKSAKFFPTPAEVIENIPGNSLKEKRRQAEEAWKLAIDVGGNPGRAGTIIFDDPRVALAIESCAGGWPEFVNAEHPEKWLKRDFIAKFIESDERSKKITLQGTEGRPPMRVPCQWLSDRGEKIRAFIEAKTQRTDHQKQLKAAN